MADVAIQRTSVPEVRSARKRASLRTALKRKSTSAFLMTLPLILLVAVGIFEFGRAYQTTQILTNAAREGARVAILPDATTADVQARVSAYLRDGQLGNAANATVAVNQNATMALGGATTASASVVTVNYPFSFIVLNPVVKLVAPASSLGAGPFTMSASAQMRNEAQ